MGALKMPAVHPGAADMMEPAHHAAGRVRWLPHWRARAGVPLAVLLALVLPAPLMLLHGQAVFWLFLASGAFAYGLVALSLDLLMGRSGQISLGHNGFFAVGAYTAALVAQAWNLDLGLTTLLAGATTALAGLAFGVPATRLRGHYLGIVTLGFGIAVYQVALAWSSLTGGDQGLSLPPPHLLGIPVGTPVAMYYVLLGALLLTTLALHSLKRSKLGRAWAAARDNEIAAAAMGVPLVRMRSLAFLFSTFLAGAAGCLYAFLNNYIAPEDFGMQSAMLFFAMVIVGGMDSLFGALAGAAIVDGVQQAAATVSGLSLVILGGMITLVAMFFPGGLKSLLRRAAPSGTAGRGEDA